MLRNIILFPLSYLTIIMGCNSLFEHFLYLHIINYKYNIKYHEINYIVKLNI